jgi:hypothetical protein
MRSIREREQQEGVAYIYMYKQQRALRRISYLSRGQVAGAMSATRKEGEGMEGEEKSTYLGRASCMDTAGQTLDESVAHAEGRLEHKTSTKQRQRRCDVRRPAIGSGNGDATGEGRRTDTNQMYCDCVAQGRGL